MGLVYAFHAGIAEKLIMKKNSALKANYKRDFKIITKLLNEFDPCGLIDGGAPDDEYDCLTGQILSLVYKKTDFLEIKKKIIHEIEHNFGLLDLGKINDSNNQQFAEKLNIFL